MTGPAVAEGRTALAETRAGRRARPPRHQGVFWGAVGLLGELLLTAGVVVLLFVGWQLWWTDVEANRAVAQASTALTQGFEAPAETPGAVPDAKAPGGLIEGEAFALLHVPRLGQDWSRPIFEGTGVPILREGLGHYVESAAPGQVGNFAVAGHRTTWGRPFHDIETLVLGDSIVVETRDGYDVYAVTSHEIVAPTDVDVVAPVPGDPTAVPTEAMLTLTTCHPKFSAEQRYIIHARLTETFTREQGLPASILAAPAAAGQSSEENTPHQDLDQRRVVLTRLSANSVGGA